MQDRKGNETCNKIVYSNLSIIAALKKLKLSNYTSNTENATINDAIARKDKLEEVCFKDSEYECSTFSIRRRNNFCCESFVGSPICNLGLGLAYSIISISYQFTSLLDTKKELIARVKN